MHSNSPHIVVVACGSTKVPLIAECLQKVGARTTTIDLADVAPKDVHGIQGIVYSGAPKLVTQMDMQPLIANFAKIVESNPTLPVLGICFGHQLLGMYHGAKAFMGTEDRDFQTIVIEKEHPLFEGLGKAPLFHEDHCEYIALPTNFIQLASSSVCPLEAMAAKEHPHLGVQFHPETSGENGQQFFANWLHRCAINQNAVVENNTSSK